MRWHKRVLLGLVTLVLAGGLFLGLANVKTAQAIIGDGTNFTSVRVDECAINYEGNVYTFHSPDDFVVRLWRDMGTSDAEVIAENDHTAVVEIIEFGAEDSFAGSFNISSDEIVDGSEYHLTIEETEGTADGEEDEPGERFDPRNVELTNCTASTSATDRPDIIGELGGRAFSYPERGLVEFNFTVYNSREWWIHGKKIQVELPDSLNIVQVNISGLYNPDLDWVNSIGENLEGQDTALPVPMVSPDNLNRPADQHFATVEDSTVWYTFDAVAPKKWRGITVIAAIQPGVTQNHVCAVATTPNEGYHACTDIYD